MSKRKYDHLTPEERHAAIFTPDRLAKSSRRLVLMWADPAHRANIAQKQRAAWAVPGRRESRGRAISQRIRQKWEEAPELKERFAKRMSDRMKERHASPEWSARLMAKMHAANADILADPVKGAALRKLLSVVAKDRYEKGMGLASPAAKRAIQRTSKWIMTRANQELGLDGEFLRLWDEAQAQYRAAHPYDGPLEGSDYMEYLGKMGKWVTTLSPVRPYSDAFMAEAIPRAAAAWRARKKNRLTDASNQ